MRCGPPVWRLVALTWMLFEVIGSSPSMKASTSAPRDSISSRDMSNKGVPGLRRHGVGWGGGKEGILCGRRCSMCVCMYDQNVPLCAR